MLFSLEKMNTGQYRKKILIFLEIRQHFAIGIRYTII